MGGEVVGVFEAIGLAGQCRELHLHPGGGLVELAEAQDAGGIVRVGAAGALSGAGALSAVEWVEGGEEFLRVGDAVAVAVSDGIAPLRNPSEAHPDMREMLVFGDFLDDALFLHDLHGGEVGERNPRLVLESPSQIERSPESLRSYSMNVKTAFCGARQQAIQKTSRFRIAFPPKEQGDEFIENVVARVHPLLPRLAIRENEPDFFVVWIAPVAQGQPAPCIHK